MAQTLNITPKRIIIAVIVLIAPTFDVRITLALLQAPTLELQALVQQELEQKPLLEEVPDAEVQADKAGMAGSVWDVVVVGGGAAVVVGAGGLGGAGPVGGGGGGGGRRRERRLRTGPGQKGHSRSPPGRGR